MDDDVSHPKLKRVRAEIEDILKREDIAGVVVLHTAPGNAETFANLSPSYSILKGLPPKVRLLSKLADYNGDVVKQRADQAATANMISSLGELLGGHALALLELSEIVDKELGTKHTRPQVNWDTPTPEGEA